MDVDFVVLWVDGNDPEWLKEKNKYQSGGLEKASTAANRFRDWDLMKYWFRAVEKYAPWVRTVHFVTWGHLPSFLNRGAPKLHIVNHEDFLPAEFRPTFSSHALELNLWRIQGLSECFVYFNDDVFLTRPTEKDDFFDEKARLPRMHFQETPIPYRDVDCVWLQPMATAMGMVNRYFDKRKVPVSKMPGKYLSLRYPMGDNVRNLAMKLLFPNYYAGFRQFHGPCTLTLDTFRQVWEKENQLMRRTSLNRFRSYQDPNIWTLLFWQMASGQFSPKRNGNKFYNLDENTLESVCADIVQQPYETLCINDAYTGDQFSAMCERLSASLKKMLPEKCSFEL